MTIKNYSIFEDKHVRKTFPLFCHLVETVDEHNRLIIRREAVARKFHVTSRTISNWIHVLARNDVLKFKYSGTARLNPDIYYSGGNVTKAKEDYASFRGDI
ncbi:MAG: replication/maintenance protein RepL [Clostridia bacterium]|nr:replication/maintenance protein RepL [Clostridia bacterium]